MNITEARPTYPSSGSPDGDVFVSIRQTIATFLQRCGLQYVATTLDEALYTECCQEAIKRGFPIDGDHSIRLYIDVGVAIFNAYSHLPDHATRMWICLLVVVLAYIDDKLELEGLQDMVQFTERFANCQPQGHPVLKAFDALLREAPRHYSAPASNLIVVSLLNFISSILIDHETKDMQASTDAPFFPAYHRYLSGLPDAFGFFIFPSTVPLREYIQCMPDFGTIVNYGNDILSYYKEEIEGDTANYVSLVVACRGLTKLDALHEIVEKTVQAHHNILASLKPHHEAYDAYVSFFQGFFKFHAATRRYRLEEIVSQTSCCNGSSS